MISAVVALPPTLAAIHFGSPFFDGLVALGCAILIWEWGRLCGRKAISTEVATAVFCSVGAILGAAIGRYDLAFSVLAAGVVLAGGAALVSFRGEAVSDGDRARAGAGWISFGLLYVGIPTIALIWLRDVVGRDMVFWLFALVWATDTGAYAFGRLIGGPKLMPRVSPKKTWAGLIGGIICSSAIGAAFSFGLGKSAIWPLIIISGALAVVAQSGDLFESWVKRRFGVKDAGSIMPGHGGLLDRVDGLLAVSVAVALIALINRENGLEWL